MAANTDTTSNRFWAAVADAAASLEERMAFTTQDLLDLDEAEAAAAFRNETAADRAA